jgi:hypothetical protein
MQYSEEAQKTQAILAEYKVYICICVCKYLYIYLCIYLCIYVCIFICIYTCINIGEERGIPYGEACG